MNGGKSRWIDTVWQRLGKVGVFAEPCCGTAVMTLNNPEPAPREVICDLNAYICNFYRALRADPDAVAYWADWPTNHHDLTARHRWLLAQGPELRERMTADPDDYDCKIAGWWVWGQSSWIGHGWCDIEQPRGDTRPQVKSSRGTLTGQGVSAQRVHMPVEDKRLPVVRDQIPAVGGSQQQRDQVPRDGIPRMSNKTGGRGVQQQNLEHGVQQQRDQIPHLDAKGGGKGVQVQQQRDRVPRDQVPHMSDQSGASGVSMQRDRVPGDQIPNVAANGSPGGVSMQRAAVPRDGMPHVQAAGKGRGVNMQRVDVPGDRMPHIGSGKFGNRGQGVQQQRAAVPRDGMPRMPTKSDGQGVAAQRRTGPGAEPREVFHGKTRDPVTGRWVTTVGDKRVSLAPSGVSQQRALGGDGDGILDGSRLRPWFRAIAERLARCIILNRSWESALTDSVLQQTPSSPKPSVGVFLDPPYRTTRADGGKRSTGLYQGDNDTDSEAVARATYEWAVNGRNKLGERYADKYRIAYCMHEGDFDVPPGWTAETMGFSGHRVPGKKEKAVDQVIFSPACVPVPTDPQLGFGW